MRKPITSGAVVILLAVIASFAAEGAQNENHKFCFPGRWKHSIEIHM